MSHVRVALCQMQSGEDVEENVRVAEELLDGAADGGADLAALPEGFSYHGGARRAPGAAAGVSGARGGARGAGGGGGSRYPDRRRSASRAARAATACGSWAALSTSATVTGSSIRARSSTERARSWPATARSTSSTPTSRVSRLSASQRSGRRA